MFKIAKLPTWLTALLLAAQLHGCASLTPTPELPAAVALYQPRAVSPTEPALLRYAPWFEVEAHQHEHNRIGAPAARLVSADEHQIFIDTDRPTIYTMVQKFSTSGADYTNLIYRVHFPKVPCPHLTQGRNVGLLVYVTINEREEPLLVTTLHTCGCYLGMVPTSNLEPDKWPTGWNKDDRQRIYGEKLPSYLELHERIPNGRLVITLRGDTHRVKGLGFREVALASEVTTTTIPAELAPASDLEQIALNGGTVSFYEKAGWRKGYVKDSGKPLERLFMSWWAFDPLVGEDKALGPAEQTGTTFYTSLKFWARKASDIWDFPEFLKYWGWNF